MGTQFQPPRGGLRPYGPSEPNAQLLGQSALSESSPILGKNSLWIPPRRRKRKSAEITVLPGTLEGAAEGLKKSKVPPDQPSEEQRQQQQSQQLTVNAIFENGMRKTAGRGRMNSDYTGVVLPLMDEYAATPQRPAQAPWMAKVKNNGFGSGMER